ncbi:MAG: hypothetical protein HZT40_15140 [Candidatus Thiothrix singaporensis]|uniref:Uncharacterized protein n=1 Tax=Candidatus Thiothrix singaporensis TaxID=2799669 RepID=A0A7L6AUB2_9GAMM|nr:MAG: hypothetical protein HZT40_15140 [Candidatus Thiothrix singaporensis]
MKQHPLRGTPLALVFTTILLLGGTNTARAEDPKTSATPPATASQPAAEPAHVETPPTAVAAVDAFYKDYLNFHPAGDDEESLPPEIGLSESFKTDIKKSDEVCQNFDDGRAVGGRWRPVPRLARPRPGSGLQEFRHCHHRA